MQRVPDSAAANPRLVVKFSNLGHLFTHLFTLLYATAVLHLPVVFGLPFGEMLALSSLGLILYGICALPAGWLADRYSQTGMMVLFFAGIGAGAVVTGLADTPSDLWIGLTLIGAFASIYHPVGIAWLLAWAQRQGMALGINGVFGGVGSALAPLFVGAMVDTCRGARLSWCRVPRRCWPAARLRCCGGAARSATPAPTGCRRRRPKPAPPCAFSLSSR